MTLSKRGDYVMRSALCLARAYPTGQHRKIRQVVAEVGVPQTYASQILADLVRAGLATSRAGRDGGYLLARPPETISVLEVVEAGEGPLAPERCALGDGPCRWDQVCPLHETWQAATEGLRQALAETTLATAAERDRLSEARAMAVQGSHRHAIKSVTVQDQVQVDASLRRALDYLGHEASMTRRVREAYAEAEALRLHLDPEGAAWSTESAPAVRVDGAGNQSDGRVPLDLAWQATLAAGSESRLDAAVELWALGPERTRIRLDGRFRPPTTDTSSTEPDGVARRLADATVRAFLRGAALAIELHR